MNKDKYISWAINALIIVSSIILVACGGGGGGAATEDNTGGVSTTTTTQELSLNQAGYVTGSTTYRYGHNSIPNIFITGAPDDIDWSRWALAT